MRYIIYLCVCTDGDFKIDNCEQLGIKEYPLNHCYKRYVLKELDRFEAADDLRKLATSLRFNYNHYEFFKTLLEEIDKLINFVLFNDDDDKKTAFYEFYGNYSGAISVTKIEE